MRTTLVVIVVLALGIIIYAVFDVGRQGRRDLATAQYNGNVKLVQSQRAGCRRGLADRHDNAEAWYLAYLARKADERSDVPHSARQRADRRAVAVYLATARDLNSRTYGPYSVTLSGHPPRRPLGAGSLSCRQAFPWPKLPHVQSSLF